MLSCQVPKSFRFKLAACSRYSCRANCAESDSVYRYVNGNGARYAGRRGKAINAKVKKQFLPNFYCCKRMYQI